MLVGIVLYVLERRVVWPRKFGSEAKCKGFRSTTAILRDLDLMAEDSGSEHGENADGPRMCRRCCYREREIMRYVARPPKSNNYRQHKNQQESIGCGNADSLAQGIRNGVPHYLCRRANVSRIVQQARRLKHRRIFSVVDSSAESLT